MQNRKIAFRAWDNKDKKWLLGYDVGSLSGFSLFGECMLMDEWSAILNEYLFNRNGHKAEDLIVMQFTGLLDTSGLAEVYEGDILDTQGLIKGNIYESPQIYKKGIDCLIETMGTKEWRNTESVAVGLGCKYAK